MFRQQSGILSNEKSEDGAGGGWEGRGDGRGGANGMSGGGETAAQLTGRDGVGKMKTT